MPTTRQVLNAYGAALKSAMRNYSVYDNLRIQGKGETAEAGEAKTRWQEAGRQMESLCAVQEI